MNRLFIVIILTFLTVSSTWGQTPKQIIEKIQSGKAPTPKELTILEKYANTQGEKFASMDESEIEEIEENSHKGPSIKLPKPLAHELNIVAASPGEIVKIAQHLVEKYAPICGANTQKFASDFPNSSSVKAGDFAALLLSAGAGSASVFSAAWSVKQNPSDIVSINNLGAALSGMGDEKTALRVLLYGHSLRPDMSLIEINAAWAFFNLGDIKNAETRLKKLTLDDDVGASAYLGLAAIEETRNNQTSAAVYYKKADDLQRTPLSFAGVRKSSKKNSSSNSGDGDTGQDSGNHTGGNTQSDTETGVIELPSDLASVPEEEIGKIITFEQTKLAEIRERYLQLIEELKQRAKAYSTTYSGNVLFFFERNYDRETMMIDELDKFYFGEESQFEKIREKAIDNNLEKSLKILNVYNTEYSVLANKLAATSDEHSSKMILYQMCKLSQRTYKSLYELYYVNNSKWSNSLNHAIKSYYSSTNQIFSNIYDPLLLDILNVQRQLLIVGLKTELNIYQGWAMGYAKNYKELECVPPPPPPAPAPKESNLEDAKSIKCPLGNGRGFSVGVVSMKLDCSSIEVSGGQGLLTSIKYDFKNDQTTIFLGVGVKKEGVVLSGELSGGCVMTFDGNNSLTDIGVKGSAKGSVGTLSTEFSGRAMALSGVKGEWEGLSAETSNLGNKFGIIVNP